MNEIDRDQNIDPLRQFGRGDLRYLEAGNKDETTANIYLHLLFEYKAMDINLTPEQMIDHVTNRVGLTDVETERIFPSHLDQTQEDRESQILKVFLSVAYTDSMLIPGALKQVSRKPALKWEGKTIIDMLSEEKSLDEFTYTRYKLFGAEITSA